MLINSLLLLFLFLFSFFLFFINNLYLIIILLFISIIIGLLYQVKLFFSFSFIIFLSINFLMNYLLGDLKEALLVTLRLFLMFMVVNIIIKKIGIYNMGYILGKWFHSKSLSLIIVVALSFIPIMMKEIREIKRCLVTKNYPLNIKNFFRKPSVFVITFFSNLFKKVDDLEKVLLTKGIE